MDRKNLAISTAIVIVAAIAGDAIVSIDGQSSTPYKVHAFAIIISIVVGLGIDALRRTYEAVQRYEFNLDQSIEKLQQIQVQHEYPTRAYEMIVNGDSQAENIRYLLFNSVEQGYKNIAFVGINQQLEMLETCMRRSHSFQAVHIR